MDRLFVNPNYQRAWDEHGWRDVESVVKHFLPDGKERGETTVRRVHFCSNGKTTGAFFKLYDHGAGNLRFWMRASKARREFENYATLARLGVPAAEAIACGEERGKSGRLKRAFIFTCAVPNACSLDEFIKTNPSRREREQILGKLAESLRQLHAAAFFYYDLVWRNILISRDTTGCRVFLIDCPRGRHAASGLERRRLRDLASLDKSATRFCTRAERVRFLLQYMGKSRVDDEARIFIQACLRYRRIRWPEDWRSK